MSNKARQLRCLYGLMWMWPGKKTLFMGSDFGQTSEWRYNASLDWHLLQYIDHEGVQLVVRDLNAIYRDVPGLAARDDDQEAFEWINNTDGDNSTLSFIRKGKNKKDTLLVVGNFTPIVREGYRCGVPFGGHWKEIFNSDAEVYGGMGYGNFGGVDAEPREWDGREHSIPLTLPPHSVSVFRWKAKK